MSDLNLDYGPGARHESHELDEERSWALLGASGLGRVGFVAEGRVKVFPVNYIVLHGAVYFRTSRDGEVASNLPQQGVALQTDTSNPAIQSGWSVLVSGPAEAVEDREELTVLFGHMTEEPWAGGIRDLFVRIAPESVTGRQVYLAH